MPATTLAHLRTFPQVAVVERPEPGDWRALFWRFLPAGDSAVEVLLSRDADSRLTMRERAAVDAWLASDRDSHVMRDHPDHCSAILGGMWGVRNQLLHDIATLIDAFPVADFWQVDQQFLAAMVAPRVRTRWLEHDEYYARRPFPARRIGREFVGQPFDAQDHPLMERPAQLAWVAQRVRRRLRHLRNGVHR